MSFEKLVLVGFVAVLVIGPSRMPLYAHRLAELIRAVRSFREGARARAEQETGLSADVLDWHSIQQYDPRPIIREALDSPAATQTAPARKTDDTTTVS